MVEVNATVTKKIESITVKTTTEIAWTNSDGSEAKSTTPADVVLTPDNLTAETLAEIEGKVF